MPSTSQPNQVQALTSFLPSVINYAIQALGIAAILLVITQTLDLDLHAKDVRARVHYKGNVLVDMTRDKK